MVAVLMALSMIGCAGEKKDTPDVPVNTPETTNTPEPADSPEPAEPVTVRVGALKGPTAMGLVGLLEKSAAGLTGNHYELTLAGSADELTPLLVKGELDVIAAPVNLGAVLYQNTEGSVLLAAVNTLGVVYIVENDGEEVRTIEDLAGKTVYATGKGSTPEYSLRYLLKQHGIDADTDLTIEWKSEPNEVVALMKQEGHAIAMMPQPYVTVAGTQLENLRVAVNLTEVWDELDNGSAMITAGLLVRKAFADENPEALRTMLAEYAESVDFVNGNVDEAAELMEKYDIIKAGVAKKAIPYCSLVCITGGEMKGMTEGYFGVLFEQNPKAVGGALPGEDFYLIYE